MKTLVSIINWKNSEATNICLESLKKVDYHDFDIHLIDNASSESLELSDQIKKAFGNRLRILRNENNIGFGAGHNQSARLASKENYEYLIVLNNDTEIVDANIFSKLINDLEKNSKAFSATPTILSSVNPEVIWYGGGDFLKISGDVRHSRVGEPYTNQLKNELATWTNFSTGCCMAIRVNLIEEIGGLFDEDFFLYYEDTELSRRVINGGMDLLYVPSAFLLHKVSSSLGERSAAYAYYNIRNKILFNKKIGNWGIPQLLHTKYVALKYLGLALLKEKYKVKKMRVVFRALKDGTRGVSGAVEL